MEWWTHLWLNEGFASWIEYLCVDHCLPELDIWTHFVTSDYCRALELDSLKNSHPIGCDSLIFKLNYIYLKFFHSAFIKKFNYNKLYFRRKT